MAEEASNLDETTVTPQEEIAQASDQTEEDDGATPKLSLDDQHKKELGMQSKRHRRQMTQMQQQLADLQTSMAGMQPVQQADFNQQPEDPVATQVRAQMEQMAHEQAYHQQQAKVQVEQQKVMKHVERLRDKYDDFDNVLADAGVPDHALTGALEQARVMPDGIEFVYHLAKSKPEEFNRLRNLPPDEQAREMVKLKINTSTNAVPKKVSGAPDPGSDLGRGESNAPRGGYAGIKEELKRQSQARHKKRPM